jgi:hypothetical protein
VPDLAAALLPLNRAGLHPGDPVALSRATPQGLLQWHITLRPDGVRPLGGCLPTLIQWGNSHPSSQLPASGVTLDALTIGHPQARVLSRRTGSVEGTRPGDPRTRTHAAGPPAHPGWPGHPEPARA